MSLTAQERLRALLKKHGVEKEDISKTGGIPFTPESKVASYTGDDSVKYNEQQLKAMDLAIAGKSLVLTGAAGSGKTTTVKGMIQRLIQGNKISRLTATDHKWLRPEMYSIACVSFTNKAVQNLKKALPKDMHANCMTIHKLLEYQPEYFTEYDPETGKEKKTMQFVPSRHEGRPIPPVDILIIDEATMVSVDLWNLLADAISHKVQVIIIGDIHQLPPVFGKSIFIHAMQQRAHTVELTHIYRQALESPIISLAHRVKSGKQIPSKDILEFSREVEGQGKVTIHPWKKKLGETAAIKTIQMFLPQLIDSGQYDPMNDVILTPFNKSFGTVVMNTAVAGHLAKLETDPARKEVWEIYAGIKKVYLRIGEKVLYNKSEAFVTDIRKNSSYYGKMPRDPSDTMDYNGLESDPEKRLRAAAGINFGGMDSNEAIDDMLSHMASHTEGQERVSREASHIVTLYIPDLDTTQEVSGSGELNAMDLGYALTVHKSQGSEYDRVFFITHTSQANMFYRELLYTGITRAAKELYVICEPNFFVKGIVTQRVPGNTLEEKIASFDRTMQMSKNGSAELPKKTHLLVDYEENYANAVNNA
jgi:ATP-dependent exoDNAse (exonuclease V) alpha subunit